MHSFDITYVSHSGFQLTGISTEESKDDEPLYCSGTICIRSFSTASGVSPKLRFNFDRR